MPRDSNGNYTLPANNPVVSGAIIETAWANPTMDDIKAALTDSLSRSGAGGMLQPFKSVAGSSSFPGISFQSETSTGLYWPSAGIMQLVCTGVPIVQLVNGYGLFAWDFSAAAWGAVPTASGVLRLVTLTQTAYTALVTKDPLTLYFINGS